MLLLIGLQSGKGLHPDRTFKLPRLPKSPKLILPTSPRSNHTALSEGFSIVTLCQFWQFWQLLFSPVFVCVSSFRRSHAPRPYGARSCTCHKSSLLML